ncbi:MAG: CHAT domain-containing tetratricopeptide repeat protein [Gemmatimonadaceae bacterium]
MVLCTAACDRRPSAAEPARDPIFAVADSLRLEGRFAEALDHYRALRDSLAQTPDTQRHWRAQLWWADALMRLGQRDSAAAALDVAMALAGNDPRRESQTRYTRSVLLDRQGQFDLAFAEATRALELGRQSGDLARQGDAHNALGRIHSLSGRYRDALAAHMRLLAARQADGASPKQIADAYNELGIDYRHLGRFTDAAAVYGQALAFYRANGNPEGQARVLNNLANVHLMSGERDEALALLTEAVPLTQQIEDPRGQAFVLTGLATVYLQAGNLEAARAPLRRALDFARRAGLSYNVTVILLNLGELELRTGSLAAAGRALTETLTLADSLGYGRQRAGARAFLAELAVARGDARAARRWANEAVLLADSLGDPEAQYEAGEAHGAALEAAGSVDATAAYLNVIELLESWRGRLALGDLRMGVAEPRLGVYEGAIRTLLARGRAEEAFLVAERARGRLLLEMMAERGRSDRTSSRRTELLRLLQEQHEASGAVRRNDLREQIQSEVGRLGRELELLERGNRSAGGGATIGNPHLASMSNLRSELLGGKRAILAYFWGDSAVYGWWITAESVRAARLGAADSLAALADFLRGAVESPSSGADWTAPARHAFDVFVAPLNPTDAEELFVVADGPLTYVPLEVLVPRSGLPWGTARHITYGPSASVLLALARAPRSEGWARTMLAVGNPSQAREWIRRGADGDRASPLRPLPHAAEEARAIAEMFRRRGADALVGRRATLERWLSIQPARYRYLHFAAHAQVSDREAMQTALVLVDGRLDLARIRELPLRAELVTLSACETGLGQRMRGEGVIGLPHAFLAAGARSVVVTLWPIADRLAADFMVSFYGRVREGRSPAGALLEMRREWATSRGDRAHPSSWASFVLVGGVNSSEVPTAAAR